MMYQIPSMNLADLPTMLKCIAIIRKGNAEMKNNQQDMQELYDAEKDKQEMYSNHTETTESEYLAKNILDHCRNSE